MTYEDLPLSESPLGETPLAGSEVFDPPTLDTATGEPTTIVWQAGLPRFRVEVGWTPPSDYLTATLQSGSVNDVGGTVTDGGASPSNLDVPLYADDGSNVYVAQWVFSAVSTAYPIEIVRSTEEWEKTDQWAQTASSTVNLTLDPLIPVVTALDPAEDDTVATSQPTISWTPTVDTQHGFRVVIVDGFDEVWYDSGPVTSVSPSHEITSTLRHGTEYTVSVQMFGDTGGISAVESSTFLVDTKDPTLHTPHPDVGSVYEVGINGIGYMLDDRPDEQPHVSATQSLQADKQATGSEAFNGQIERYFFAGQDSWEDGAGQEFRDREGTSSKGFFESNRVDVFSDPARIAPYRSTVQERAPAAGTALTLLTVRDGVVIVATSETTYYDPVTNTDVWVSLGLNSLGADTDGVRVWVAHSDRTAAGNGGIREYIVSSGPPPSTFVSDVRIRDVLFAGKRIVASKAVNDTGNGRIFTSYDETGTEEVVGGHLTLPAVHELVLGAEVSGFVYFGDKTVGNGGTGSLWSWQLGLDDGGAFHIPQVAWRMPDGQRPLVVKSAGNQVWVLAGTTSDDQILYRLEPDGQGGLIPFVVVDGPLLEGASATPNWLQGHGDFLYFSTGSTSHGVVSLVTGGFSSAWHTGDTFFSSDMAFSGGLPFWLRDNSDLRGEGTGTAEDTNLTLSEIDAGSLVDKVFDEINVRTNPLQIGDQLQVDFSVDGGITWITGAVLEGEGRTFHTIKPSVQANRIRLRILFLGDNPDLSIDRVHVRYHMLGLAEKVVQLPVRLYDTQADLRGKPLPESRPGLAAQQIRDLEQLTQTRILFQDVDWHLTGQAEVFDVLSVEPQRILTYNQAKGALEVSATVILTLRKGVTD